MLSDHTCRDVTRAALRSSYSQEISTSSTSSTLGCTHHSTKLEPPQSIDSIGSATIVVNSKDRHDGLNRKTLTSSNREIIERCSNFMINFRAMLEALRCRFSIIFTSHVHGISSSYQYLASFRLFLICFLGVQCSTM